ncbi:MAG: aminoglycoside phosphotransferase family protein [Planctomycetes bacterium]|nr:aminoglycoside phosphotransferase family protein [Planctomycetota bacterium]
MTSHKPPLTDAELRHAAQQFRIAGTLQDVRSLQRGHIHDTFVSTWSDGGREQRFLHQRMNDKVFHDIPAVMHNIETISRHLRRKMAGATTLDGFRVLDLVLTKEDRSYLIVDSGQWRTYSYIEDTRSQDHCSNPGQAYEAARAFGWFQSQLADLDAGCLRETLPRFFSTPHRLQQFEDALAEDPLNRAADCMAEIRFAQTRHETAFVIDRLLQSGEIPTCTVHGDTKLNNVLLCNRTGRARCIVDLDTCMPGYALYDFGDLVRFTAATSDEDERDLDRVGTDLVLYRALVDGYLAGTRGSLSAREIELMPFAARLVTYTIGLRFLADHLAGDVYFKTHRDGHNLDRARVQFRMVEQMEQQAEAMAVTAS